MSKPGLRARWGKRERDIVFTYEGARVTHAQSGDGHLLYQSLCSDNGPGGKSLTAELEARGYDLTTLKFSIQRKPTP